MNNSSPNSAASPNRTDLPATGDGDGFSDGLGSVFEFDFMPEDLSESVRTAFCVVYVVIIVLGLGGNCLTMLVVSLNREMRTVTNVFLVSLAVSDALVAGINMPLQLRLYQQNEWTLGQAACKFGSYVQGVVIVASILTLISLAVDRLAISAYFHYGCALRCVALRVELQRALQSASDYRSPRNAMHATQRAAVMETGLYWYIKRYSALCTMSPVRPSVCPSVRHTGGSVKDG